MKVKATTSFCGAICMRQGEEREIGEGEALSDLLRAGYVVAAEAETEKAKTKQPKK